jgi:hypothetical protein
MRAAPVILFCGISRRKAIDKTLIDDARETGQDPDSISRARPARHAPRDGAAHPDNDVASPCCAGFREAGQSGQALDTATWQADSTVPLAAPPPEVPRGCPRAEVICKQSITSRT